MNNKIKKFGLPALGTILIITLMAGVSELLGDREIIFPEIAALAVGYLCAPARKWQVNSKRLFLLISGCAVLGFAISMWMPGSLYVKLIAAFAAAQVIYLFSGTSLAPLISAVVLPVLIGTRSVSYILSAASMTLLVILFHHLLVRRGIRAEEPFVPKKGPDASAALRLVLRTTLFALLLVPALRSGMQFVVAPPLLVAFTDWSEADKHEALTDGLPKIGILALCALIGAGSRLILTITLGLPLFAAAAAASIVMILLLIRTGIFLPPAGALTVLAMLIPESVVLLYPVEVTAGVIVFYLAASAMTRVRYNGTVPVIYNTRNTRHVDM